MTATWAPLPWDTEFFGTSIGRIEMAGADAAAITSAEDDARDAGIRCLYATLDPADAQATYRAQEAGYRFVEAATTFDLSPSAPRIARPEGITTRLGTADDLDAIAPTVATLAPWSRFAVDPAFGPGAAARLQQAWVERAVSPDAVDHSLVVAEDESGIVAFITRASQPAPIVDSVGTDAKGSGAARYLIEVARVWAGDQPLLGGPIAARNVHALRFVAHCGYRVSKVRYLFHRWLDQGQGERS